MYILASQFVEGIVKRLHGPGHLRFIIQPIVAIALGVRDGLADAKAGAQPYLMGVFFDPAHRRELLLSGAMQMLKPFIIGVVLDLILQYFIFERIRLIPAIIVGLLLIGLPYSIARGLTNRIATRRRRRVAKHVP